MEGKPGIPERSRTFRTASNASFGGDVNNRTIIGVNANTSNGLIPMTGNISTVQIYNRALSAQEIQQNYNATKARFGL